MIAARSMVMTGMPLIYLADPFGKCYAVHEHIQLHNYPDKPSVALRRVQKADMEELRCLHVRSGITIPLAERQWYEVSGD